MLGKVKVHPYTGTEALYRPYAYRGSRGISLFSFLTTPLEGVRGQRHAPAALYPGKDPVTTVQEAGWASGRSGQMRKISPPPGFDPRTVQPVASHYTD